MPQWLWVWPQNPVLHLPDFSWSSRFLQPQQNFFNHLIFTFDTSNIFGWFSSIMAKFKLIKQKFPNKTTIYVHQCGFQILYGVKQHIRWQQTNYQLETTVDTSQGLKYFSHVIYLPQTSTYQNIAKLLTWPHIKIGKKICYLNPCFFKEFSQEPQRQLYKFFKFLLVFFFIIILTVNSLWTEISTFQEML